MVNKTQKQLIEKLSEPVSIEFLAEHVPEFMLKGISRKVTKWLKEKKSPSELESLLERDDHKILSTKSAGITEHESPYWEDNFDVGTLMVDFYKDSFEKGVDRTIYVNDNAYCHIVGLIGYPNVRKILEYYDLNVNKFSFGFSPTLIAFDKNFTKKEISKEDSIKAFREFKWDGTFSKILLEDGVKTRSIRLGACPAMRVLTDSHIYTYDFNKERTGLVESVEKR